LTAYGWIEDFTPLFDVAHDCALLGFSPTSISVSHLGCRCLCLRLYFFLANCMCRCCLFRCRYCIHSCC